MHRDNTTYTGMKGGFEGVGISPVVKILFTASIFSKKSCTMTNKDSRN